MPTIAPPSPSEDRPAPPQLPIDPRIRQRRIEVRRQEGRRRLRIAIAAASVLAVVGALAGVVYSPLLRVRHIRVTGEGTVPRAQVLAAAGLAHQRLMIQVDTGRMAAHLDAVPALAEARVRRSWPGTVRIQVVERHPVARVPLGSGQVALVDPTGRVLSVEASAAVAGGGGAPAGGEFPQLSGVGVPAGPGSWLPGSPGPTAPILTADAGLAAAASPLAAALALAAAVPADVRPEVSSLTLGGDGTLRATVTGASGSGSLPVTILLGDTSALAAKLSALVTMLTQAPLSGVATIDLRVPDRPTVLPVHP